MEGIDKVDRQNNRTFQYADVLTSIELNFDFPSPGSQMPASSWQLDSVSIEDSVGVNPSSTNSQRRLLMGADQGGT